MTMSVKDYGPTGAAPGCGPDTFAARLDQACGLQPECQELVMGFPETVIAAGATVDVVSEPQLVMRPYKLEIPGSIAAAVSIDDIKIGTRSQLITDDPLPGEAFLPDSTGRLRLEAAGPGIRVTLRVRDFGGAGLTFRALMRATAV